MSVLNCGGSFIASWENSGPQSSFWKMCQLSFLRASQALSSANFPKSGMTVNGRLYQQNRWELRISEGAGSVSVIYPTPSASSYGTNQGGAAGRTGPIRMSLATMARRNMWPTPTVCGNYNKAGLSKSSGDGLATAVIKKSSGQTGGPLNPKWVEWLMGFPIGWTDLEP